MKIERLRDMEHDNTQEVYTELEFRALQANTHHREVGRMMSGMLEHALLAGEQLEEAFALVPYGEWEAWVKEHFWGGLTTARIYRRLYKNQDALPNRQSSDDLTIESALKLLSPPKDETPAIEGEEPEEVASGEVVAEDEDPAEALEKEREEVEKKEKEIQRRAAELATKEQTYEAKAGRLEKEYTEAVADVMAKYGEKPQPTFLEIPPEAWAEAFAEAKSSRVMQARKNLSKYSGDPAWLAEYQLGELAEAIKDMSYGDKFMEELRYIHERLGEIVEVVEQLKEIER